MDWSLTNLPDLGWPTAIAMALVLATLLIHQRIEARKRHETELHDAEKSYRNAVARGDMDAIAVAARRLRDARRRAAY